MWILLIVMILIVKDLVLDLVKFLCVFLGSTGAAPGRACLGSMDALCGH